MGPLRKPALSLVASHVPRLKRATTMLIQRYTMRPMRAAWRRTRFFLLIDALVTIEAEWTVYARTVICRSLESTPALLRRFAA